MVGKWEDEKSMGIVPRLVRDVCDYIKREQGKPNTELILTLSMVFIYNEKVRALYMCVG
mgnify:CR=1 FL=1